MSVSEEWRDTLQPHIISWIGTIDIFPLSLERHNSPDNPKLFHAYVGNKTIGHLNNDGIIRQNPGRMCEVFVASLSSIIVGAAPAHLAPTNHLQEICQMWIFLGWGSSNFYFFLDPSSSIGPDGLHPHWLPNWADELSLPL